MIIKKIKPQKIRLSQMFLSHRLFSQWTDPVLVISNSIQQKKRNQRNSFPRPLTRNGAASCTNTARVNVAVQWRISKGIRRSLERTFAWEIFSGLSLEAMKKQTNKSKICESRDVCQSSYAICCSK